MGTQINVRLSHRPISLSRPRNRAQPFRGRGKKRKAPQRVAVGEICTELGFAGTDPSAPPPRPPAGGSSSSLFFISFSRLNTNSLTLSFRILDLESHTFVSHTGGSCGSLLPLPFFAVAAAGVVRVRRRRRPRNSGVCDGDIIPLVAFVSGRFLYESSPSYFVPAAMDVFLVGLSIWKTEHCDSHIALEDS